MSYAAASIPFSLLFIHSSMVWKWSLSLLSICCTMYCTCDTLRHFETKKRLPARGKKWVGLDEERIIMSLINLLHIREAFSGCGTKNHWNNLRHLATHHNTRRNEANECKKHRINSRVLATILQFKCTESVRWMEFTRLISHLIFICSSPPNQWALTVVDLDGVMWLR